MFWWLRGLVVAWFGGWIGGWVDKWLGVCCRIHDSDIKTIDISVRSFG